MNSVTVSAPGKLMLFGEHAVVYGRPCIVTAVGQRMRATMEMIDEPVLELHAPDVQIEKYQKPLSDIGTGEIPKGARFVEFSVEAFMTGGIRGNRGIRRIRGVRMSISSEFNAQFGFGSSSASTVCVLKGLSELTGAHLSEREIFDLAYAVVLKVQGKGSGFDVAAAIYGGTLWFVTGGKEIEPLPMQDLPLIIGYTGVKADTVSIVDAVKKLAAQNPSFVEGVYDSIGDLVENAKIALINQNWKKAGEFMNRNQDLLSQLGVSSDILDRMIGAARSAGAFGAKLSGAGKGDCMVALVDDTKKKRVVEAITRAGGTVIDVEVGAQGVTKN